VVQEDKGKKSGKAAPGDNTAKSVMPVDENPELDEDPEIIDQIKAIPPRIRREVLSFMATFQSQIGMRTNPLFEKMTEGNIDKYIDTVQKDDEHSFDLEKRDRWFRLVYFVLTLIVVGAAVVYLLPRDKEFLMKAFETLLWFGSGFGAGYGLKSHFDAQSD
jgi:hypothetical protein